MTFLGANDWLGTQPLFYHEKTGRFSPDLDAVIDLRTLDFDPDGLRDYLDFGYCVFGRTPVRHVRFLTPGRALHRAADGTLAEIAGDDPSDAILAGETREDETIEQLRVAVQEWEAQVSGPIVLPLSGGLDSRFLAAQIRDRGRVRAFTYGLSDHPERSTEVVVAREVAARLGLAWEQVRLGKIHAHLEAWDRLMGPATHAHGMYHFEFFTQVRQRLGASPDLLSGIVGDAWAGSIAPKPAASPDDLLALGYTHGSDARDLRCRLPHTGVWRCEYWERHRERLAHPVRQAVEIIRLKMMLLRYLVKLPSALGFAPWSPFTETSLALAMVRLPPARRDNRRWQRDHFARCGLEVDQLKSNGQNSLDYRAVMEQPPPPLAPSRLREIIDPAVIATINAQVCRPGLTSRVTGWIQTLPRGASLAHRLRLSNPIARAYAVYTVLRPLDTLLARRDAS
jgi:hypothetical protein